MKSEMRDELYAHDQYTLYTRRFNKKLRCTGSAGDACLNIAKDQVASIETISQATYCGGG